MREGLGLADRLWIFGDVLDALMTRHSLTATDLGQLSNVNSSTIRRLRNGTQDIATITTARAIARALGVPLATIATDSRAVVISRRPGAPAQRGIAS